MTTLAPPELLQSPFRKNAIINGAMQINQRNHTTATTVETGFNYAADRFVYYQFASTGVSTLSRNTDVPTYAQAGTNFQASMDVDIDTANASPSSTHEAVYLYRIEGYDYDKIRGDSATFSCWVKTNKTGIYTVNFRNTGSDRLYATEVTVTAADTWEKITATVPLTETGGTWDYTHGYGLQIGLGLMAGSGQQTSNLDQWNTSGGIYSTNNVNLYDNTANYLRTTGWQFEKGDIATEFETRQFHDELAACQRYYWYWSGTSAYTWPINEGNIYREWHLVYPVTMRAIPTVSLTGGVVGGTFASTFPKVEQRTVHSACCRGDVSVTSAYSTIQTFTADAEL